MFLFCNDCLPGSTPLSEHIQVERHVLRSLKHLLRPFFLLSAAAEDEKAAFINQFQSFASIRTGTNMISHAGLLSTHASPHREEDGNHSAIRGAESKRTTERLVALH